MYFRYLWDHVYITFIFSWTVLIIKIFYLTMMFFNEVLFTSYCFVRYFYKRKKQSFISSLDFSFVILLCKRCLLGQTKRRSTLLTIFRLPGYSNTPFPRLPFIRDLRLFHNLQANEWYYHKHSYIKSSSMLLSYHGIAVNDLFYGYTTKIY